MEMGIGYRDGTLDIENWMEMRFINGSIEENAGAGGEEEI